MAVKPLQLGTDHEQGIHIEPNMQKAGVQQHRCDQAPYMPRQNQVIDLCAKNVRPVIVVRTQRLRKVLQSEHQQGNSENYVGNYRFFSRGAQCHWHPGNIAGFRVIILWIIICHLYEVPVFYAVMFYINNIDNVIYGIFQPVIGIDHDVIEQVNLRQFLFRGLDPYFEILGGLSVARF